MKKGAFRDKLNFMVRCFRDAKAQMARNIPDDYFSGYRRLAETENDIESQKCWTCKHAIGHVSWWCDKKDGCKYEQCYVRDQITKADFNAGNKLASGWVGLPPNATNETR